MKNVDSIGHLTGKSIYLDDIPEEKGTLQVVVFTSTIAKGHITKLDIRSAENMPGIHAVFTAKDIPGENQIGAIIQDEPLLAEGEVDFIGQAIAIVVAESRLEGEKACKAIQIEFEEGKPITDVREAYAKGELIQDPRTFECGTPGKSFNGCSHVFSGRAESPGQEHLYLETQGSYVKPGEAGKLKIYSSTQGPTAVQKMAARVLGIPMHLIEVEVQRLGGGFGGKEDQATPWAVMAALASQKLNRPVKLILDRKEDIYMTGKRHPYSSDFKIGLNKDLKIIAFEADYFQDAGAAADLSPAITERTLFHSTGSYFIPNVRVTANSCRTNLPPNTAFRGFGAPQAFFVIETAIVHAAEQLNVDPSEIQKANLIVDDQAFPYGQIAQNARAQEAWEFNEQGSYFTEKKKEISSFNQENRWLKRGLAIQPVCFGISFTNTIMNHSRALVHIYGDGSVGISTAAVEMGQGVNTKMIQVAAKTLSISPDLIRIESTNTTRVANTSPTAASSAVDLNGHAVRIACEQLRKQILGVLSRLFDSDENGLEIIDSRVFVKGIKQNISWSEVIEKVLFERKQLSEIGHYATPNIFFDKRKEKGHPFAYHVYGNALCEISARFWKEYQFGRGYRPG